MDSVLLEKGKLAREWRVKIEPSDTDSIINEELIGAQKEVKLKGFRPGKVPLNYLRKVMGDRLLVKAIENILQGQMAQLTRNQTLKIVGQIETDLEGDIKELKEGGAGVTVIFSFEVAPEFSFKDLPATEVEKPVQDDQDEEVENRIQELVAHKRLYDTKPLEAERGDRPAQEGDWVRFVFDGLDGDGSIKSIEGPRGKMSLKAFHSVILPVAAETLNTVLKDHQRDPFTLELARHLNNALQGLKVGESVELDFTPDQDNPHLPSMRLRASVRELLTSTYTKDTPSEDIVRDIASAYKLTEESLRQRVKEEVEKDFSELSGFYLKKHILDVIDNAYENLELPEKVLTEECKRLIETIVEQEKKEGRLEQARAMQEAFQKEENVPGYVLELAKRRVRTGFVIDMIAREQSMSASQEQMAQILMQTAQGDKAQAEKIWAQAKQDPNFMRRLEMPALEDNVIKFLMETQPLKVVEKPFTYKALKDYHMRQAEKMFGGEENEEQTAADDVQPKPRSSAKKSAKADTKDAKSPKLSKSKTDKETGEAEGEKAPRKRSKPVSKALKAGSE